MKNPHETIPACLNFLANEKRWVVWKFQERKGKVTKPPFQSIGGKIGSYAENNNSDTWSTLADAELVFHSGQCEGIGLQLQGLNGFAAIDLDDVIDASGQLNRWVDDLVARCASYCEVTPSGRGIRILGHVPANFASIHTRQNHSAGGAYEIYANIDSRSGRYITVTGQKLDSCPDTLSDISGIILELQQNTKIQNVDSVDVIVGKNFCDDMSQKYNLPRWVCDYIQHGGKGDRSADFQATVNALRPRGVSFHEALQLFQDNPKGPAAKYLQGNRLEQELHRSWQKATEHNFFQSSISHDDLNPVDLWAHFPPPDFPIGLLPKIIEDFALVQGETMGADPSGLAMAAISTCAAVISDDIKIRLKKYDSWTESPRIWIALVGSPSTKKTPILNVATAPLRAMDLAFVKQYQDESKRYNALEPETKKSEQPPKQKRLRIEDTTVEALQEVLVDNPDGLMCLQDELSGFFGQMDKYHSSRGALSDRAFWLRAYNGGEFALNRISRGVKVISNLSICLLGGIQPEPIRKLATDSQDDGLLQRICPIVLKPATLGEDVPRPDVNEHFDRVVNSLYHLKPPGIANSFQLEFSEGAQLIRRELEERHLDLQSSEIISRKLAAHIGKFDGIFGRLCVVWHCIEAVQINQDNMNNKYFQLPILITENTARRVADFMRYFLFQHAVAFYAGTLGLSDDHDSLKSIAGYILARKLTKISNRDVQRGNRAMRGLRESDIRPIFEQLEALGWLTRSEPARQGGQLYWNVNPEVHRKFLKRAELEARRRSESQKIVSEVFNK